MLDAIRNFFAATLNDEPPCEAKLSAQLDALAVAYHATPNGEPVDDDQRPPASEYYATRDRVRARFPELGCFSVADPMNPSRDGWMECSASDALADIIGDLEKVLWRLETFGEEDARWHFRMLYEIHWGRHLRELQLYLFARLVARLSDQSALLLECPAVVASEARRPSRTVNLRASRLQRRRIRVPHRSQSGWVATLRSRRRNIISWAN